MKMFRNALLVALLATPNFIVAGANEFDSTSERVGWKTNGYETPVNQFLSPTGTQVQLPGVRPNALAISPEG